ncbi:restriction endonuclease subunit S [Candidatus Nitrotoga arctica]|uniref:Type I restriction-modification system, specificity subunit S n=1 Tax=Candidatus Nitrotoga arctica TaxID=453162 RepID=A0ABN8APF9_9PROT|nr:restriction endonuclease subunit S [Candidatus Nitrotoga arctica]CAG9932437.1 Type I restriction-modification system, specificity subunit S [Candidatus Nitrotoga arctica]
MSKWQTSKLGDISEMCLGKMLDEKKNKGELEPYLANINVRWGGFNFSNLNKMRFEKSEQERYGLRHGDLVICEGGEPGRCAIWKDEVPGMKIQKALHRVRVRGSHNNEFVYYRLLLAGRNGELSKHFIGSTIKHLTGVGLKQVEFPYPSVEEQQKIAAALSALDSKIACNNRINAELEAMAKTLYDYWFVQFDFPDATGKPYKSSGGKMVYNPTLKREIPAGWESGPLSEWIACNKTGDWGKESIEGNYTLQVDCIRGTDINGLNGAGGTSAPTRFILEKNRDKILEPFDFVIEISGGSPTQSTGRMAFVLAETINRFVHPIICSNFCKAISLKDNAYFFNFAYEWQSAYDNKILFGWEGKTSGIKNLLFDAFVSKYLVCKPPQKLAQRFLEFVSPLQIKKQKLLQENDELEALRDWLLPMLMNGQVTVA